MTTAKQKILIVDDETTNIQVLNATLRNDYNTFFATNGQDALHAISEIMPDLILLDVQMPDMDGYQVCRQIKSDPLLQDIPVIFLTSLNQQQDEAIGLELGAVDFITIPYIPAILNLRIRNHLEMKRQRDILASLSHIDGLTGIANRRAFDENIDREWRRAMRSNKQLSVLMIDIDCFKLYNDSLGHLAGDDCLREVARTLQIPMARAGDLLTRFGGEEFVAILPETHGDGAELMANKLLTSVRERAIPHPASTVADIVTVSIGAATCLPENSLAPISIVEAADLALYRAKQEGRNRVAFASKNRG
jgi:diguanylate cyclase (GGDEF)-like protein